MSVSLAAASSACCAPCLFDGDFTVVTPPFELNTQTSSALLRTVTPLVTIDATGGRTTTGYRIGSETIGTLGSTVPPIYVVNGATLTAPTSYAYYTFFDGAVPRGTGAAASVRDLYIRNSYQNPRDYQFFNETEPCASNNDLFQLDIPAVTTYATAFMSPLAAGVDPAATPRPLPASILDYLEGQPTVQMQMRGLNLALCSSSPYFATPCSPSPRPTACGTRTGTITTTIAISRTITVTISDPAVTTSETSYSIEPSTTTTQSIMTSDPCTTTLTVTLSMVPVTTTVTAFGKHTADAVTYSDSFAPDDVTSAPPPPSTTSQASTSPPPFNSTPQPVYSGTNTNSVSGNNSGGSGGSNIIPSPSPSSAAQGEGSSSIDGALPSSQSQAAPAPAQSSSGSTVVPPAPIIQTSNGVVVTASAAPIASPLGGSEITYYPAPTISTLSGTPVTYYPSAEGITSDGTVVTLYPSAATTDIGGYIISGINPGASGSTAYDGTAPSAPTPHVGAAAKNHKTGKPKATFAVALLSLFGLAML